MQSTSCLGLDQKEFFAIINHESHFRPLIGNTNMVYGAGQLTGIAIAEVHRRLGVDDDTNLRQAMESKFGNLPNSCSEISSILEDPIEVGRGDSPHYVSTCERTGLPQNPGRSFLYGGLIYQFFKLCFLANLHQKLC